jgi:hypothetical protein
MAVDKHGQTRCDECGKEIFGFRDVLIQEEGRLGRNTRLVFHPRFDGRPSECLLAWCERSATHSQGVTA